MMPNAQNLAYPQSLFIRSYSSYVKVRSSWILHVFLARVSLCLIYGFQSLALSAERQEVLHLVTGKVKLTVDWAEGQALHEGEGVGLQTCV